MHIARIERRENHSFSGVDVQPYKPEVTCDSPEEKQGFSLEKA
jgi:hypothetical protein